VGLALDPAEGRYGVSERLSAPRRFAHGGRRELRLAPDALASLDFTYGSGPTQRFVADVQSPAPVSRNALPGGNVWDNSSPYFKNEAERWRRNQNRPVWILKADVIKDAKERIAYDPLVQTR